jgi:hypothetical protein
MINFVEGCESRFGGTEKRLAVKHCGGARCVRSCHRSEARAFYVHVNFDEFPSDSLRLMLSLKEVRAAIAAGV